MFNMYLPGWSFLIPFQVSAARRGAPRARGAPLRRPQPVCSFVGNRKSFFLDAFPGCWERTPEEGALHAPHARRLNPILC